MDQDNQGVLNLDEMLGEKKLKIKIGDKEYGLRTVKSLSPQEFGRVMAYGTVFANLKDDALEKDGGMTVMKAIDDLLEILAPSLPRYVPTLKERFSRGYKRRFNISVMEATAIFQFWSENNRTKNATGAVMPKPRTRRR